MKALQKTQKMFKVFKVIAQIIFIFAIVLAGLTAFSFIGCLIMPEYFYVEISNAIEGQLMVTKAGCLLALVITIISLAEVIVVSAMGKNSFKMELAYGSPFEFSYVKKLRKDCKNIIIIDVIISIVNSILGYFLIGEFNVDNSQISISILSGFGMIAIVMLLLSNIFEYGASLKLIKTNIISEPVEVVTKSDEDTYDDSQDSTL